MTPKDFERLQELKQENYHFPKLVVAFRYLIPFRITKKDEFVTPDDLSVALRKKRTLEERLATMKVFLSLLLSQPPGWRKTEVPVQGSGKEAREGWWHYQPGEEEKSALHVGQEQVQREEEERHKRNHQSQKTQEETAEILNCSIQFCFLE